MAKKYENLRLLRKAKDELKDKLSNTDGVLGYSFIKVFNNLCIKVLIKDNNVEVPFEINGFNIVTKIVEDVVIYSNGTDTIKVPKAFLEAIDISEKESEKKLALIEDSDDWMYSDDI